jgi:hypothetical protein
MADTGDFPKTIAETASDVEMGGEELVVEIEPAPAAAGDNAGDNEMPFQEEAMEDIPARVTYLDYLKSPVIGLLVGQGEEQAFLTAHQGLLNQSPFFASKFAELTAESSVCRPNLILGAQLI